ncbi:hypothetical protein N7510_002703 [Penicillium lagena]|uniref:uncharacterized protein n=1 Tax=Penicillium lagena TaxID=94218 RepID=UPI002540FDFF|nr:uncharacterized protein N7510_002703 [Penicillium lagena]KAJ5626394.1 hypothetical protein N7510_002703 [Penicillium lagena]
MKLPKQGAQILEDTYEFQHSCVRCACGRTMPTLVLRQATVFQHYRVPCAAGNPWSDDEVSSTEEEEELE